MILPSSTISPPVCDWLQAELPCRILHVFERACNLINARDQILSIVEPGIAPGPFSLVLREPLPQPFVEGVSLTTAIARLDDQLVLGPLRIEWGSAVIWNPEPDWVALREKGDRIISRIELLEALGARFAPRGSFFHLNDHEAHVGSGSAPYAFRGAARPARALGEGIVGLDFDQLNEAATALSGLGPGLTPAGDDFLCGALLASRIIMPAVKYEHLRMAVVGGSRGRTNVLSTAYLKAAGRGEIHMDWHLLFHGLVEGSDFELEEIVRRICAWGHSSGADTLGGFLRVLNAARQAGWG